LLLAAPIAIALGRRDPSLSAVPAPTTLRTALTEGLPPTLHTKLKVRTTSQLVLWRPMWTVMSVSPESVHVNVVK
jgi:hypothetical protein